MAWFVAGSSPLVAVAAKAALMYGTALIGLRLGERRTLAQWTLIDFAAAVAVGAIVGRTAIARDQTYAVGAVALLTILALHRLVSVLRFNRVLNKLVDHRVRVLVVDGRLRRRQLRLCGLTDDDVYAELRQSGHLSLSGIKFVLYEAKGALTVVPSGTAEHSELVDVGLAGAADRPPS